MRINSKRGFALDELDDSNIIIVKVDELRELAFYNKNGKCVDLIPKIKSEEDWCLNIQFKSFDTIGISTWIQIGSEEQMDFGYEYNTKDALQYRLDNLQEQQ